MVQQPDGSSQMGVTIPLKYLLKGAALGNFTQLPNGDPIPFMPAGEMTGVEVDFPQNSKYRLHLYLAVSAAAVFIETPDWSFPPEVALLGTIGFPVKNVSKTQINGYFAIVPNKGTFASGVYVASRLPTDVAILLDDLVRF